MPTTVIEDVTFEWKSPEIRTIVANVYADDGNYKVEDRLLLRNDGTHWTWTLDHSPKAGAAEHAAHAYNQAVAAAIQSVKAMLSAGEYQRRRIRPIVADNPGKTLGADRSTRAHRGRCHLCATSQRHASWVAASSMVQVVGMLRPVTRMYL